MKIIVIGCTHAGTAAVTQMAKLYPEAQITVYERNDNISFLSCGIALHVGGVVHDAESLFYSSPDQLAALGVQTKMLHDVVSVDTKAKTVVVRDLIKDETVTDTYDKLVMTTGSWPIIPKMEGIDLDNILLCKNYAHAQAIIDRAKSAERIVVVGAGYIGIELVEAFEQLGKQVTVIDNTPRVLYKYLDAQYTDIVEEEMKQRHVRLALNQSVTAFAGENGKVSRVITNAGEYEADLVIMCIGFARIQDCLPGRLTCWEMVRSS